MNPARKTKPGPVGIATLICAASLALLAQDSATWVAPPDKSGVANPVAVTPESLAAGLRLYTQHCAACHGKKGYGDGPRAGEIDKRPKPITTDRLGAQSDGALFWKISEGRKPMPTFSELTTPTERWQIINYVRTLKPKPKK